MTHFPEPSICNKYNGFLQVLQFHLAFSQVAQSEEHNKHFPLESGSENVY